LLREWATNKAKAEQRSTEDVAKAIVEAMQGD
jgi:hypothetical protein